MRPDDSDSVIPNPWCIYCLNRMVVSDLRLYSPQHWNYYFINELLGLL
jgi:hypothetical protein